MSDETENKFDPQRDIPLLQKQITMLVRDVQDLKLLVASLQQAMLVALEDPSKDGPRHTLQDLRENWLAAERRADDEEKAALESGGILSDVCDIAFEDEGRAGTHGYDGIREQVKDLVAKSNRWQALRIWLVNTETLQPSALDHIRAEMGHIEAES